MPKTVKEIPLSHWNMPNRLLEWPFQKRYYWCPKAYVGWSGLGLHFWNNGRVNWVISYNIPGRPKKVHVLGELHPQTFRYQEAEKAGRAIKEAAKKRIDLPVEAGRVSLQKAGTVREMGERFLLEWSMTRKRTAARDIRIIQHHVIPAIGGMKPAEVEYDHVWAILEKLAGTPAAADHVKAVISKMFNWGIGPYKVKHNPTAGIPAFDVKPKEDDAEYGAVPLTLDQVGKFWYGLDEIPVEPVTRYYARFLLLTGVRPVEAAGGYLAEINESLWTVPGIRMKKGRSHRVPLSDLALEQVRLAGADFCNRGGGGGSFMFPSPYNVGKKPIGTNALRIAMRKNPEKLGLKPGQSPYSLRKFVATTIGGLCHPGSSIRYTDDDVGLILAHKRGAVTALYNQEKYDDFKRTMLQQLADEVRKRI